MLKRLLSLPAAMMISGLLLASMPELVSAGTINGKVTTVSGGVRPVPGVTITISGSSNQTAYTSDYGTYSFVAGNGNYIVTPSVSGHSFTPYQCIVGVINGYANNNCDFYTNSSLYKINGAVAGSSGSTSGIIMKLSGSGHQMNNTFSGNYNFDVLNGTYTITPYKSGYTFSPKSKTVTVLGANVTLDFSITQVIEQQSPTGTTGTFQIK